uniref:Uncharacterized protein n=1 Tax=Manihot esculenta TaxID=3983 RepID=A0A2C9U4E4_MANES
MWIPVVRSLHRSGICQRIINFITGLVFPGFKRIIDHTASIHDPLVDGVGSVPRDAEIGIHFKQSDEEGLERWTPVDKLDSSVHSEEDYQVQFNKGHNISNSSSAMPSDKVSGKRSKVTESLREKEVQLPIVDVHGSSPHQGTKKANQPTQQQKKREKVPNLTSLAQERSPQNDSVVGVYVTDLD